MSALHSILVPIDGSLPSLTALDHAIALAEEGDTRIDVLHVAEPETFSVGSATPLAAGPRHVIDEAMEGAVQRARERLGARVSLRIMKGDTLRTIVDTAREGRYDLIVLGTHGRIGRLHAILGSVAEGVVRNAPCPVLTVREAGGGYQSFAESRHGRSALAEESPPHVR